VTAHVCPIRKIKLGVSANREGRVTSTNEGLPLSPPSLSSLFLPYGSTEGGGRSEKPL